MSTPPQCVCVFVKQVEVRYDVIDFHCYDVAHVIEESRENLHCSPRHVERNT